MLTQQPSSATYISESLPRLERPTRVSYLSDDMHPDSYSGRYQPTSPLSPRMSTGQPSISSQSTRARVHTPKQSSRMFRLDMPAYSGTSSPSSAFQSPAITLHRGTQPSPMESPRLMREKQKELIARAQLTSKLAASNLTSKPEAPRLDPLGSPQGAVTPLALEEQESIDYFSVTSTGGFSPIASPAGRSSRSGPSSSTKEEKVLKLYPIELCR